MPPIRSFRASLAPYPREHVASGLEEAARLHSDSIALVDGSTGRELSFAQCWEAALRFARRLLEDGVKKGDRVAIFAVNSPEYVIAFHGILLGGAVATTINSSYKERELREQLLDADPS